MERILSVIETAAPSLLAFIVAVFVYMLRSKKPGAALFDNVLILFVIGWKATYLLFFWREFRQAPISILYFDGGLVGMLLTFAVVLAVAAWKYRAQLIFVAFELIFFLALYSALEAGFSSIWVSAVVWSVVTLALLTEKKWAILLFVVAAVLLLDWPFILLLAVVGVLLVVLKQVQMEKSWIGLAILLVLLLFVEYEPTVVMKGTGEPVEITLRDLEQVEQTVDFAAKDVTIVNFFATWCPPCKAEMPHLQNFADRLPSEAQLIGVNLTKRDDGLEALSSFASDYDVTYPILMDEHDQFGKQLRITSIPTTIVFDEEGVELQRFVGPVDEKTLTEIVARYKES